MDLMDRFADILQREDADSKAMRNLAMSKGQGPDMSQASPTLGMGGTGMAQGPQGAPQPPGMGQQMRGGGLMSMPGPQPHQPMMEGPGAPNSMAALQGLMSMSKAGQQQPREQMDPLAMMPEYLRGLMYG